MNKRYLVEGIEKLWVEAPAFAEKIAPIYEHLGWLWYDSDDPPKEDRILESIHESLYLLAKRYNGKEEDNFGSGGITVGYYEYNTSIEFYIAFEHDCFVSIDKKPEDWR